VPLQKKNEDFYIGYLPHAPRGILAHVRKFILAALACGVLAALLFVINQKGFAFSVFEFLQTRTFEGVISVEPCPSLLVTRPGKSGGLPSFSRYYLVAEGKHGAQQASASYHGQRVKLQGKLIFRDDQTMLELVPDSIEPLAPSQFTGAPQLLGTFTLTGEIVDSKCFLGVMNPGERKTHQACAVRCIAGGIPPILITRDAKGDIAHLLLLSASGRSVNREVLEMVAQPVEITGEVWEYENLLALRSDPAAYRLLQK
jgi:hypothetical protein